MTEEVQERQQSNYRAVTLCLALCAAILPWGSIARAQSVAFINPGKSDEIYWVTATQGMQAVAKSLGMTFEVQYAQREHLKTLEIAREMVARPAGRRPEYIVITNDYAVAGELLKIIDGAGVKSFLAYSSIPLDQRAEIGAPRTKYKGWLGSLEPQAEDAGYLTARALIERGKKKKRHSGPTANFTCWRSLEIGRHPHRSTAIRACAARSPKIPWSFSNRRCTRRGLEKKRPSKPNGFTSATPMSSWYGRGTI
jgi:ABC-type sugar transport system substrate-binding protein